ncbi:MAG: M6 family metalloprotease domain-containing protein [Candidatus Edwardsbacteria bacterium]|nr:M6 family metalloprotease domain-containing protein [Candidatus Edwardsbacteria bacterium]
MRTEILYGLILGALLAVTAGAMPPRPGVSEPASLAALRLKGLDSPRDGLIQQLWTKDAAAKISGSRSYPVVMGYFPGLVNIHSSGDFQSMLFSSAAGVKSVNNYYRDMSYGVVSCSGSVADWASSSNFVSYYGNGTNGLTDGTTRNTYEFILRTLDRADSVFDFSSPDYDLNHDGYVDVLWVVHAGKGGEEGGSDPIWSHSFQLTGWTGGTYYVTNDISTYTGNPVRLDKYIIMPERTNYADGNGSTTEMIGAGVFAHEFGHALGLPDLYDTGGFSISGSGLGLFSLMAAGSWGGDYNSGATPVSLDVWCKRFLGWLAPVMIKTNGTVTVNNTLATASNSSYHLAQMGSEGTMQFWLVENRWKTAAGPFSGVAWDANLLSQGLAIYHIDSLYTSGTYFSSNQVNRNSTNGTSQNRPYGVALEETDIGALGYSSELWIGANYGEAVDLWSSATQADFDSLGTGYPVSYLNNNSTRSGIAVMGISAASAAMGCNMYVIPGGGSDFNIGIMQNPAFTQYLNLAAVSGNLMPSTPALDTALMTVSAQVETLGFAKISDWTYKCEYQLKTEGQHHLHLAAVDSGGTWRSGDRFFEVVAAKTAGNTVSPRSAPITLNLPAGALARDLYLAIFEPQAGSPPGTLIMNPVQIGPAGMFLLKPAILELSYDHASLGERDELRLGLHQLKDGAWEYLPGQIDKKGHKVIGSINSLGIYALSWDAGNPALAEFKDAANPAVWPNPFRSTVRVRYQIKHQGTISISIYNILGQQVNQVFRGYRPAGDHDFSWDGRDGNGRQAAPGIYYYRVSGASPDQTGRMVLVK